MTEMPGDTRRNRTRFRSRIEEKRLADGKLSEIEAARLRFHVWQMEQCPCGYEWDNCGCITDAADEIAH
jgi:hypothetical protein